MPVFLKDPSDTSGALRAFDSAEDAKQAIAKLGWQEASPEEVQQRTAEKAYGDYGGRAFLQSAAAGAFDVAVSPVRGAGILGATLLGQENKDPYGEILSGRNFEKNLYSVLYELTGQGNAEAGSRIFEEEMRNVAKANPWASTTGYLAGGLLGGGGLSAASGAAGKAAASAAASSALGRTAARQAAIAALTGGAVEGAALAPGQAGEQAFIDNHKLTSEQVLGALGWGTLLGGGLGAGLYGAGAVYRGAKSGAASAVNAAGERASNLTRSLFGPRVSASAETVNEVGERVLGTKPADGFAGKMKDVLNYAREQAENAQVATTGVSPDAVKKYGGLRWDSNARRGRDLYLERDAIIDGAKKDFADALTAHGNATEGITKLEQDFAVKKERVQARLSDNLPAQLAEARTQADALEEKLLPLRQPGKAKAAGAAEPIDKEAYLQTFRAEERDQIEAELHDEVSDLLEATGVKAKPGGKTWQRAEQQVLEERVAPQRAQAEANAPVDPRVGSLVDEVGHRATLREVDSYFSRQLEKIRATTDPAEAFVLLKNTKSAAQRWADRIGKYANGADGGARPISPEKIQGARRLAEHIDSMQEPLRQSLMNEAVWGNAGADERAINAAFTRYLEGNKLFNQSFMLRESTGYMGKTSTRIANEKNVGRFLDRMGRADNVANERYLRSHLKAGRDLVEAINDAGELGEHAPLLEQVRQSEQKLSAILDKLDETVSVANQIDEVMKADSGGIAGAKPILLGGMLGGPFGALLGYGFDVATSPGKLMRQAIGIQRLAKRFDSRLDESIESIFERPRPVEPTPPAGAARPANDTAEEVFKDEVSEVRPRPPQQRGTPYEPPAAQGESPVSLAGKSLEDLGALPFDEATDRASTIKGLRESEEFARTGRAPRAFDREGHERGITISVDPTDGKPYLTDGRHRFSIAREKDLPSIWGTVRDADTGEILFRGDIPMKETPKASAPKAEPAPKAAPSPPPAATASSSASSAAPRQGKGGKALAAVPLSMALFLGDHTDKQEAFRERAREIRAATDEMGEGVRQVMTRDLGEVQQSFPQFASALTGGLTRGALFLESKLPKSYRAASPGAPGRSTQPVSDYDLAKFARYWSAVHDPVSVLTDVSLGTVSSEQIEALKAVYPELYVSMSQKLLEKAAAADAAGRRLPIQTRSQIGRFVGVQIEPAFKSSVLDLVDQARGARDQQQAQPNKDLNRSAPLHLAQTSGPESTQMKQRQAGVY